MSEAPSISTNTSDSKHQNDKIETNKAEQKGSDDINEEVKKSDSSYYLYKSTNKEEAKKYAPKKLDTNTAKQVQSTVKSSSKGSTWNTGATMEQFDYSEWMKLRIKELLLGYKFKNSSICITEVVKVEGSATILLVRGKYRPGFDISFECKWKGFIGANASEIGDNDDDELRKKAKQASGVLKMNEITSEDDADDWEYEVSIKKKSKMNKSGLNVVKKNKEGILEALEVFIKELKAKK